MRDTVRCSGGTARVIGRLDALLPAEMATLAEEVGVRKVSMESSGTFALAVLAGAFIALGGVFSTVVLAGAPALWWGAPRVLAGLVFSTGLILVVVGGAELFTGNNLIVMAWASGRVRTPVLLRHWAIVYVGNFVGAFGTATLVFLAGLQTSGAGAFGVAAVSVAAAKVQLGFIQAVALGVLCNALVCLAVWLTYSARTTADKILAITPPISAFVAAGFEHSIANMYFVPLGCLVATFDPGFLTAHDLAARAAVITPAAFLVGNLIPVTLGNLIGGTLLVGGVYWFIYLRPRSVS
jgi:formate/nitrite transporter